MDNAQIKAQAKAAKAQVKTAIKAGFSPIDAEHADSYRSMSRGVQMLNVILGLVILFLSCVLLYNIKYRIPHDRYFAVAGTAGKMQMLGLNNPYLNTTTVSTWSAMAATSVLTFGFNDMEKRFEENKKYFTADGWASFTRAMTVSGLVDTVNANQQIITAIAQGVPIIGYSGMRMGRYTWIVDIPMSMTIRAGSKSVTRQIGVRLTLVRMPTADNPMGIGIDTWYSS